MEFPAIDAPDDDQHQKPEHDQAVLAAEAMEWVHTADDLGVRIPGIDRVDRSVVDFPVVAKEVGDALAYTKDDIGNILAATAIVGGGTGNSRSP